MRISRIKLVPIEHSWFIIMKFFNMFRLRNNHKIFYLIVELISIFMMNHLISTKLSIEIFFHNMSVFKYSFSIDRKFFVSKGKSASSIFSFHSRIFIKFFKILNFVIVFVTKKPSNYIGLITVFMNTFHREILPCRQLQYQ